MRFTILTLLDKYIGNPEQARGNLLELFRCLTVLIYEPPLSTAMPNQSTGVRGNS